MIFSFAINFVFYFLWSFLQFRLAKKVNHPSPWMAFVPILNTLQFLQLAKLSRWWIFALWFPGIIVWAFIRLAYNFGEKKGFGLLLLFPPLNIWALWKLGQNTKDTAISPDDQETINEIQNALNNGYTKEVIVEQAQKEGLSIEKIETLLKQIEGTPNQNQTKSWVIVLLALLELPLFLLIIFLIASNLFFSLLSGSFHFEQKINNETIEIQMPTEIENAEDTEQEPSENTEEIDLSVSNADEDSLLSEEDLSKDISTSPESIEEMIDTDEDASEEITDTDENISEEIETPFVSEEIMETEKISETPKPKRRPSRKKTQKTTVEVPVLEEMPLEEPID